MRCGSTHILISFRPTASKIWEILPVWDQMNWGAQSLIRVQVLPALLEFIEKAKAHGVVVGLSTWWRQDRDDLRMTIRTPQDHARVWIDTLRKFEKPACWTDSLRRSQQRISDSDLDPVPLRRSRRSGIKSRRGQGAQLDGGFALSGSARSFQKWTTRSPSARNTRIGLRRTSRCWIFSSRTSGWRIEKLRITMTRSTIIMSCSTRAA